MQIHRARSGRRLSPSSYLFLLPYVLWVILVILMRALNPSGPCLHKFLPAEKVRAVLRSILTYLTLPHPSLLVSMYFTDGWVIPSGPCHIPPGAPAIWNHTALEPHRFHPSWAGAETCHHQAATWARWEAAARSTQHNWKVGNFYSLPSSWSLTSPMFSLFFCSHAVQSAPDTLGYHTADDN